MRKFYETFKNFVAQTCRGLQKLIGYEPSLSGNHMRVVRSPEDITEPLYFPKYFSKATNKIYSPKP